MVFCRGCGKEIHESAPSCPSCGAVQAIPANRKDGSLWMPITSMVLGIICALALFDDSALDNETILGLFMFAGASIGLGAYSISTQKAGKGMAIAGLVLSVIALLALLGSMT